MPELPEVEKIKRILEPQLTGRVINSLSVNRPEIIEHPSLNAFNAAVTGEKIVSMDRRGKYLFIVLEKGCKIVLHLRMTGCLLVTPPDHPLEKHTHLVFRLDDENQLRFQDVRRFGRFWLLQKNEEDTVSGVHKLGPEPYELNDDYLSGILAKRKRAVKECLLDQRLIAGIGNIYADEILYMARLHPRRSAGTLSSRECERLAAAIVSVLTRAVEENLMTPEEYLAGKGRDYRNASTFQVYGHAGEPCQVCGNVLCRTVVAGRGSVYCPSCQQELSC